MHYYDEEIIIKRDKNDRSITMSSEEGENSGITTHDMKSSNNKLNADSLLVKDKLLLPTTSSSSLLSSVPKKLSATGTALAAVGKIPNDSFESDSDLSKSEENLQTTPDRLINSGKWKTLNIPQEIKDCFQHILKYTPQTIDIEYHLQPFLPEYIPAVGDVDAFLKVSHPTETLDPKRSDEINDFIKCLGFTILDEPSGNQSEPTLLSMKLHSVLTNARTSSTIEVLTAKSDKDIDKWITEIDQLHMNQMQKRTAVQLLQPFEDVDNLMSEWPVNFEQIMSKIGLPSADIDCTLSFYSKLLCALFDINISNNTQKKHISAIYTLFNLYLAINNSLE